MLMKTSWITQAGCVCACVCVTMCETRSCRADRHCYYSGVLTDFQYYNIILSNIPVYVNGLFSEFLSLE